MKPRTWNEMVEEAVENDDLGGLIDWAEYLMEDR